MRGRGSEFRQDPVQRFLKRCPVDRILLETDSPYLAPEPMRGHRNTPANVRYICEKAAELHGISAEEMARITYENAMRVYRIAE